MNIQGVFYSRKTSFLNIFIPKKLNKRINTRKKLSTESKNIIDKRLVNVD